MINVCGSCNIHVSGTWKKSDLRLKARLMGVQGVWQETNPEAAFLTAVVIHLHSVWQHVVDRC